MKKIFEFVIVYLIMLVMSPWLLWHRWPFILHGWGKHEKALATYKKRLSSKAIKGRHEGVIYFNIGLLYKLRNNHAEAKKYFLKAKEDNCRFDPEEFPGNKPLSPESQ